MRSAIITWIDNITRHGIGRNGIHARFPTRKSNAVLRKTERLGLSDHLVDTELRINRNHFMLTPMMMRLRYWRLL
ncbi:Uncharacterised protein [Vibrio cholerae]|uniref:Uncharacterized protein n=1 Tax=Vibrio cholerae TaxID=666 RepID=A0A655SP64_VIBCL|nr:Uncharacterised protein [Vibrio cholerae]CRZ83138.1 Uncharacterised protein [Vibrio cholerae]CSA80142.1 Uncharacterised protein [Vibrio cholerae]CSB25097.1 Uncharacterised protein [Vibrio cholerae]CSB78861.1 Uncharacterised protein [Vibrio cholerae]